MAKRDLTGDYEYARLIEEEKGHYSNIEVTEDLKEGGVHAGGCWQYYWTRVNAVLSGGPIGYIGDFIASRFSDPDQTINILSLGSGYCGNELDLARRLKGRAHVICTDINNRLFAQAQAVATAENLGMEFRVEDLNFISIEPAQYHMIFAHAVLHHVINLESLFDEIAHGLRNDGFLHLVEVVGENRRLIWPENEVFANLLLEQIPNRITDGQRLVVVPEDSGMEGIRQEDIIPELRKAFHTEYEYLHGAFMRFVCTNEELAVRFDPRNAETRRCLDFLIDCDVAAVNNGILRPLEVWGVYKPRAHRDTDTLLCSELDCKCPMDSATKHSLQEMFDQLPLNPRQDLLKDGQSPLEHQRIPIARFRSFLNPKGMTILEIGADDAVTLSRFAADGMLRGLGINNWYWSDANDNCCKLTERIVLAYGDIRSLPLEARQFDAIFTCAAFEHIQDLDIALVEMHRLLKPSGLLYSYFGPLWSSGIGHHLWFEHAGHWHRFTEAHSTLPILEHYDHLLYDRDQMAKKLSANWEPPDIDAFLYQIYDNPHINRYMYSDYIRMFSDSKFEITHLDNMGRMEIPIELHDALKNKYGHDEDFSCATLEVVLTKR